MSKGKSPSSSPIASSQSSGRALWFSIASINRQKRSRCRSIRSRASSVVVTARRMKLQSELWANSNSLPAGVSSSRCWALPTPQLPRRAIAAGALGAGG
ncbi:MAG: hypothetical protein RLZZ263_1202 [Cyanobacteriota bacterium]